MASQSKPLLLVISQVYVPDPASVGQHIGDVAEMMGGRGKEVRVLTSSRGYESPQEKYPPRERRGGVDVVRLPLSSFGKRSIVHRLLGQSLFLMQVIVRGVFARRLSSILVSTSPPMASFAAILVGMVRRVPITYWVMDLNPDQAIALGKVSPRSPLVTAMRWLNRRIFARAAAVVVLDRFMAERIERQYVVRGRMVILPPWPHVAAASRAAVDSPQLGEVSGSYFRTPLPVPHRDQEKLYDSPLVAEKEFEGRFVVMYSGNHSPANPVTTLLEAALALRNDQRFVFLFVGGGLGKREVEQAIETHRPKNIRSLPYQPLERLQESLSAADVHVVTLGDDMVGIIHPCKIYGAMAVGRPVLLVGPRPSHAADLIEHNGIGWQVNHVDVTGLVTLLRSIVAMPRSELVQMGDRAQRVIGERFAKEILCGAMCDVLDRAAGPAEAHEPVRRQMGIDRWEPVTSDVP
jgi:glycosyltransferase involved in cell wall biosynthesis